MKTFSSAHLTDAKKDAAERRYRNILAASGDILESNEVRDIAHSYVMGRDGKLIPISSLAKNPDAQTENYSVNLVMNHGHTDPVTGERIVGVEDIIGDARVWLDNDGLHARIYFANDDPDADHCWAISDNASYSLGADQFPDGYDGAGNVIDEPVVIVREISMVDTGNDPRAVTIDTISGKGASGAAAGDNKLTMKGKTMGKTIDQLTPDERDKLKQEMGDLIDRFTTDVPEGETEPTARDNKEGDKANETTDKAETEEDGATEPTATRKSNDRVAHQTVRIVRQHDNVRQERAAAPAMKLADFKKSEKFNDIVRKSLRENDMSLHGLDAVLAKNFKGIMTRDDIVGLPALAPTEQLFVSAFEGADGILRHVRNIDTKAFRVHFMGLGAGEKGRAHGHRANDEKIDQELNDTYRDVLTKTIYKRNPIDEEMLYENPQLLNYTDEEIDELIRAEIERGIVIGDGRSEPAEGASDLRIFDGTRGIWSIKADAAATTGAGALAASTITLAAEDNLYTAMVKARGAIKAPGRLIVVTKSSAVTSLLTATTNNGYLVQPGTSLEQFLQVGAVYTPEWMDGDSNLAYVFAENQFALIGQNRIVHRNTFDTKYDKEVRMGEIHRGGSLIKSKSAVAIAPAPSIPAGK